MGGGKLLASEAGQRSKYIQHTHSGRVLVIDDSYRRGKAYHKVRGQLAEVEGVEFIYGAIYTTAEGVENLDFWGEVLSSR